MYRRGMASEACGDVNLDDGRVAMTVVCLRLVTDPSFVRSNPPYWYQNTSMFLN